MSTRKNQPVKTARLFAFTLLTLLANSAQTQDKFSLDVEAGQGVILRPGVDPYTFSAQAHPALGFGADAKNFLIGGTLAAVYDNPEWAFMWGGRLVILLSELNKRPLKPGPNVAYATLHLTGAVLLENSRLRRLAGGLLIDVWEGALLINPRAGYDRKFQRAFLEVGLGMGF
ncbi:MAG: hypothetical protein ONB46_00380 [candidate division KSB1 bacterium]|nr:hypothetical protein [candidate division KSB1 bacterium]MDZ7364700.1 hypothetical protein [candidate division KSB1 bacterium]MDZ7402552.1 hypothetical protein [candidate division KSB1 bacterium]